MFESSFLVHYNADHSQFYSYGAFNNNEFSGRQFQCQVPSHLDDISCIQFSGDFQLRSLGIKLKIWQETIALLGLIGAFCIGSGLLLHYFPIKVKMSKKPLTEFMPVSLAKTMDISDSRSHQEVTITLSDYAVVVQKVRLWRVLSEKSILKPFATSFVPGKLNVIMFVTISLITKKKR
jgi:hypothetical protein